MFIYRFKINFEEQEGFSRDIELLTDQTFMDLHNILSENLSFDKSLECTLYMCDHRYRKRKRIYQPGYTPAPKRNTDENENNETILYMDKCILSDYIDDPHQKFLYVYDVNKDWNFYIELSRIMSASPGKKYPNIAASQGGIPLEISRKPIPLPGINDEDDTDKAVALDDDETTDIDLVMDENESDDEDSTEDGYAEEDLEELDDSGFYDDSIQIGEDFDEGKN